MCLFCMSYCQFVNVQWKVSGDPSIVDWLSTQQILVSKIVLMLHEMRERERERVNILLIEELMSGIGTDDKA